LLLAETGEGRFASIKGYTPGPKSYEVVPTFNVTFNSRFSTMKFNQRMLERIASLTVEDFEGDEKVLATFDKAKAELTASMEKTLAGDRSGSHREAHVRCYAVMDNGVKIHFVTEKGADNKMQPVLDANGNPTAKSIMVSGLEVNRTYVKEGIYKKVNSQAKTIMKKMIEKKIGKNKFKTFSLKEDNFQTLAIDNQNIETADVF